VYGGAFVCCVLYGVWVCARGLVEGVGGGGGEVDVWGGSGSCLLGIACVGNCSGASGRGRLAVLAVVVWPFCGSGWLAGRVGEVGGVWGVGG